MPEVMSSHQRAWYADTCCSYFSSYVDNYKLIVKLPKLGDRLVRFLVLRQNGDDGTEALIGSGSTENLLAAMNGAAQMAVRLTGKEHPLPSTPDRQQPVEAE
jgi:hypothetical protein